MPNPLLIADAAIAIATDLKAYDAGIQEAEKSGKSASARIRDAFVKDFGSAGGAAKTLGKALLAAAGGLALKGLKDLDDAVQEFTANTGASAEEAQKARKAINEMSARNIQPVKEIGAALGKVHTDLGLAGDAAAKTTEDFLKFARVTKNDAASEVAAFDDILDSFGLTADHIPTIMDKLIASSQKYGGVIAEDEAALAAMAPQLKAFNLGIDDGIALLNLFKVSGLDAASIPRALTAALANMPPNTSLPSIIAELSSIEDDGQRAHRAMEIFGTKAGPLLANAIRPGIDSLDEFGMKTDEVAGKTTKAADALDKTWGAKAQLILKALTTKLVDTADAVGPLLGAVASVATIINGFGWTEAISKGLKKALLSKPVLAIFGVAGAVAGAVYEEAWLRTAIFLDAIKAALARVAASPAIVAAGSKMGGALGIGMKAGLVLAAATLWVEVVNTYNDQKAQIAAQTNEIGANVAHQIAQGSLEELEQSRAALRTGLQQLYNVPDFGLLTGDAKRDLERQLYAVELAISKAAATSPAAIAAATGPTRSAARALAAEFDPIPKAATAARFTVADSMYLIVQDVAAMPEKIRQAASDAADAIYGPIIAQANLAKAERDLAEAAAIAGGKKSIDQQQRDQEVAQLQLDIINQKKIASDKTVSKEKRAAANQQVIDDQLKIAELKQQGDQEVQDAKDRVSELNQQKIQLLAELAGYGDQAAADALRTWADSLLATKNLTAAQQIELNKLLQALDLVKYHAQLMNHELNASKGMSVGASGSRGIIGFAQGGDPSPLSPSWVGELGRELFVPKVPGTIIRHDLSERINSLLSSGGGGNVYQVMLPAKADVDPFGVADELRRVSEMGLLG